LNLTAERARAVSSTAHPRSGWGGEAGAASFRGDGPKGPSPPRLGRPRGNAGAGAARPRAWRSQAPEL